MSATRTNMYVNQGVDFLLVLDLQTNTGDNYEVGINQYFCSVSKLYSTEKVFDVELTPTLESGEDNLEFYISPDKTRDLKPGRYNYDMLMTTPAGYTSKIMEGFIFILPSVTKIS